MNHDRSFFMQGNLNLSFETTRSVQFLAWYGIAWLRKIHESLILWYFIRYPGSRIRFDEFHAKLWLIGALVFCFELLIPRRGNVSEKCCTSALSEVLEFFAFHVTVLTLDATINSLQLSVGVSKPSIPVILWLSSVKFRAHGDYLRIESEMKGWRTSGNVI